MAVTTNIVALDTCPYCGSLAPDIGEHRAEWGDPADPNDFPGQYVCQDMSCNLCRKSWTVELRPVRYYTYDANGRFVNKGITIPTEEKS